MRTITILSSLLFLTLNPLSVWSHGKPYHSKKAHKEIVEFAPGVISTKNNFEINAVFNQSGDKVIFARCDAKFTHCTLMQSDYINGEWNKGKTLPFSGQYLDADPYFNEDYSTLYFISKRPITQGGEATKTVNFWRVSLSDGQWGKPEYLAELSSNADDLYPSFTDKGDFFFPSFRNEQRLLYVAKKNKDGFDKPIAIPATVYGKDAKIGDSAVSRDGKTIIFSISNRKDSKGKGDLYISHLNGDQWSVAKSLGDIVNSTDHEFTPIMSPDGKYLFFTRIENGLGNIYQIHKSQLNW